MRLFFLVMVREKIWAILWGANICKLDCLNSYLLGGLFRLLLFFSTLWGERFSPLGDSLEAEDSRLKMSRDSGARLSSETLAIENSTWGVKNFWWNTTFDPILAETWSNFPKWGEMLHLVKIFWGGNFFHQKWPIWWVQNLHGTSRSKSRLKGVGSAKMLETFRPASHSTPLVSLAYASGDERKFWCRR
jgi:hypothetical protein